ncbi:MAG: hypothetical protein ACFFDX_08790 [Candidatus Odinarchaeota archaeon]
MELYWLGVLLAVLSGLSHFSGMLIEKSIINKLPPDVKLMKSLIKTPLWLFALFIRFGLGSAFFMIAEIIIGPAIVPGLMACGLIVLAVGSVKIIGEKLTLLEIIAILMMIIAITMLGFSELSINLTEYNLLDSLFIIRMIVFTSVIASVGLLLQFMQSRNKKYKGILLAILSGFMFSLSNFWIGPLMGVIAHVFSGEFSIGEFFLFIISSIMLVVVNVIAISKMAAALRYGDASKLVPIQNLPSQSTPSIVYFLVFLLPPPTVLSAIFFIVAIVLIITSSFILGKRQAQMDEIKKEN